MLLYVDVNIDLVFYSSGVLVFIVFLVLIVFLALAVCVCRLRRVSLPPPREP